MHVPAGYVLVEGSAGAAIVRRDLAHVPLGFWWQDGQPLPGARGRGGAAVLEIAPEQAAVARTYRRGGWLGRALGRRYLDGERAFAELAVLVALQARSIPVVVPLAAARRRSGLFWRMRLVTELVAGAEPLPAFVARHAAQRRAAVRRAGQVVQQALAAGLIHADLHPDNLLARAQPVRAEGSARWLGVEVRLLDLDKAQIVASPPPRSRIAMLTRMARYLHRHARDLPVVPGTTDLVRFLAGMGMDRGARREMLGKLAPVLRRQLARHRLVWRERALA